MPFDRFMIAPLNEGLQADVRPWLIMDTAFAQLTNAYSWRGRVRKRTGTRLLNGTVAPQVAHLHSRLRVNIGTTDAMGDFTTTVPGAIFSIGQLFSIEDQVFTVIVLGNPSVMLISGTATLATYDTTTGVVIINGADPLTDVYFYSAQPVMGFITREVLTVNDEVLFAFDTQFAYEFANGGWERLAGEAAAGDATWNGSNSQFFWGTNYRGNPENMTFLFVSNFNAAELNFMRYFNTLTNQWNSFAPQINAPAGLTVDILTARLIVSFQGRLLLLNTIENNTIVGNNLNFQNRVRYSVLGQAIVAESFRSSDGTDGNFEDNLGTTEAITSAEFIKNRLIVFFERSTWEIVYTGNEQRPFRWQQINTELGVESTFSVIPFDKVILGVGNTGVHACNGANVERIDSKIPDAVFDIHDENDGVFRVAGIRDYFLELVYWAFPDQDLNATFPTRLLVYNYKNGSWAFFDDSVTAFGYFQNVEDRRWNSTNETWESTEWTWGTASQQARFRQVIGGNQEGFTFILDEQNFNEPSLQITNIPVPLTNILSLVIINHNLNVTQFIFVQNCGGVTGINGAVFKVNSVIDANTITIDAPTFAGVYTGNGVISRVSQIRIRTKQYNFYADKGRNAIIQKVDFMVDKATEGEVIVNFYISSGVDNQVDNGLATGALVGTSVLDLDAYALAPQEISQSRIWHPVYLQSEGEVIQLEITLTDEQMLTFAAFTSFQLHAMTFYARPSGRLQ